MANSNYLLDKLREILTKNIDLSGRKVINAGRSKDPADYVTRQELIEVNSGTFKDINAPKALSPVTPSIDLAAHASTHELGGSDEVRVDGLKGELKDLQKPKLDGLYIEDGISDKDTELADTLEQYQQEISDYILNNTSGGGSGTNQAQVLRLVSLRS